MLSGASSSAPRWSVDGLTGNATACSRGSSSRPPPEATAEMTASTRKPRQRDRQQQRARPVARRSGSRSSPASDAGDQQPRPRSSRPTRTSHAQRRQAGGDGPQQRGRRRKATGALRGSRERASVEESAVDTGPVLPDHLGGRRARRPATRRAAPARRRRPRPPARAGGWRPAPRRRGPGRRRSPPWSPRRRAGRRRRTARRAAAPSGSWKAARITDSRRPMPWLKPAVTRCAASPRSKRSSRSRARSSQSSQPAQPGGELEVLPRGGPRHQAADVGAVAGQPLDRERVARGRRARRRCTMPAVGGIDPGQHPHRRGLAGAVAAEQRGGLRRPATARSMPRTASTAPKRTCRPRTSTTARGRCGSHAAPFSPEPGPRRARARNPARHRRRRSGQSAAVRSGREATRPSSASLDEVRRRGGTARRTSSASSSGPGDERRPGRSAGPAPS